MFKPKCFSRTDDLRSGKQGEPTALLIQSHGHGWGKHILGKSRVCVIETGEE